MQNVRIIAGASQGMAAAVASASHLPGVNVSDLRKLALNAALKELDELIQSQANDPQMQMGLLMMAQVISFRRLLVQHPDARRGKLIKIAGAELEKKLREHCLNWQPEFADNEAAAETQEAVNAASD